MMAVLQNSVPVVLSVAGSDCSAGAGAQADLKTFSAHGVYGLTALTCVVAEVPGRVHRVEVLDPGMLADQLWMLFEAFPVSVMKTGMVPGAAHVRAICAVLDALPEARRPRIVVDPVMVASSGDQLVGEEAIAALGAELFPRACVLTPNMNEATALLGRPVTAVAHLEPAARDLVGRLGTAVLVKGGHLGDGGVAVDCLVSVCGEAHRFEAPLLQGRDTHGTGCTLSSAIAARLALGDTLDQAVAGAKHYVHGAIDHILRWDGAGGAVDALNHFAQPGK